MMAEYILVMRDDHYAVVGPFTATDWLDWQDWCDTHGDDPRWQSIELSDPAKAPEVLTVQQAKNHFGGGAE
jgi:hypothetical protein